MGESEQIEEKPRRIGRIISAGSGPKNSLDLDDIPFVPAFDLLESPGESNLEEEPSAEEIAAIGVTLAESFPYADKQAPSGWLIAARIESVSQRF